MIPLSHDLWALSLFGKADQRTVSIYEAGETRELFVTVYDSEQLGGGGLEEEEASEAYPSGWTVIVAYKVSPDTYVFTATYSSEREARNVMEDIIKEAAEVESLVKQEKFEEAETQSEVFISKLKANTSETPVEIAQI